MKKNLILAFIAIFITGSLTKAVAQSPTPNRKVLHSGQVLKVKNNKTLPAKTMQQKLMRANALSGANDFWAVAQSYYNSEYSSFSFDEISEIDYCTNVSIDGDKATFSNLVDNSHYYGWSGCNEVTGKYDAEKGTVTISTPTISDNNTRNDYTLLGDYTYYGSQLYVVLLAGDFSSVPDENGVYPLYMEDELVFDVSEDGTTLTPRTGYGAYALYADDNSNAGYMTFYKSSVLTKMSDEPNLALGDQELDLTPKTIFTNSPYYCDFKLKNMGLTKATYTVTTSTDELKVLGSNQIPAGSVQTLSLELTAKNVGPFTGTITFTDQNGKSVTLTIKANVQAAYDYSSVIKNGEFSITHFSGSTSSAEITSDITGFPVLVTTNSGDGSVCGVNVNIDVPDGQVATFSWKGRGVGQYPNQALVVMDDKLLTDSWDIGDNENEHDLDDKIILKSGSYEIMFGYSTQMDWYTSGVVDEPLRAYYYDFDLELYPEGGNNVDVYSNDVRFDTVYYDKMSKVDTLEVKLYNLNNQPLKVTAVQSDGPFSAIIDGQEIAPYETGLTKLTFTRNGVGEYTGDVKLITTGGDVTIHCTAVAEKIIYDYSPIVTEGDFSFDTSIEHPWLIDGNKAYSSTSGLVGSSVINSWLEASFVIPENNIGTLTWDGRNSSAPFWNFMDDLIFTDGTIIYVDGIEVTKFAGTLTAGSDQLEQPLVFSAGQHNVRFLYRKLSSEPEGEDRYVLYNLSLELAPATGINNITGEEKVIKDVEYYTISGERISSLTKGINIIKRIYNDGTSSIKKVVVK